MWSLPWQLHAEVEKQADGLISSRTAREPVEGALSLKEDGVLA